MKRDVRRVCGAMILCAFGFVTNASAQVQSWSTELIGKQRWKLLSTFNNTAVLDGETGLVWEQSPDASTSDWYAASQTCLAKNVGNRQGWRLPSIQELSSLIDPSTAVGGSFLPAGNPFSNVQASAASVGYWSSTGAIGTPVADGTISPVSAYAVNFYNSGPGGWLSAEGKLAVALKAWCVRTGSGPDGQ
jgi:hypothetical protein